MSILTQPEFWKPTCCILRVVHLPVVGAAALVQPRVRGRAAVPQRAGAAAHGGLRGVKVLRTLETIVIIPTSVQPAVAVLPLCVRYPQIPGQISEQQAVQQAHHPGDPRGFGVHGTGVPWGGSSRPVTDSSSGLIYERETRSAVAGVQLCHRHLHTIRTTVSQTQCEQSPEFNLLRVLDK